MLHPLESKLADAWPPSQWADVTVLVAVSGGADSVALLRAMTALKTGGAGRLCGRPSQPSVAPRRRGRRAVRRRSVRPAGCDVRSGARSGGWFGGPIRRRDRSRRPIGSLSVPGKGRRPAGRPVRRYRPHRRRPGRDDPAPNPSRHGHPRFGGDGPGKAAGPRHADPALAGRPPRGVAGLSRRISPAASPRPQQPRPAFHAESDSPRTAAAVAEAVQSGRGRSAAAAGESGRRSPSRGRRAGRGVVRSLCDDRRPKRGPDRTEVEGRHSCLPCWGRSRPAGASPSRQTGMSALLSAPRIVDGRLAADGLAAGVDGIGQVGGTGRHGGAGGAGGETSLPRRSDR